MVVKLKTALSNRPLALDLKANLEPTAIGQYVSLAASLRTPAGTPLVYAWDFGDGSFESGPLRIRHRWKDTDRDYVIRVSATDMEGSFAEKSQLITVGQPTTAKITGKVTDNGQSLGGVRVNARPPKSRGFSTRETKLLGLDSVESDCEGDFYAVGLANEPHIVTAYKYGYSVVGAMVRDLSQPIQLEAVKTDGKQTKRPRSETARVRVQAKIDGTDELCITNQRALWRHLYAAAPTDIAINGRPMDPPRPMMNMGANAFLREKVKLKSAVLLNKVARGTVEMHMQDQMLIVRFEDPQIGAADYSFDIEFEKEVK